MTRDEDNETHRDAGFWKMHSSIFPQRNGLCVHGNAWLLSLPQLFIFEPM